MAERSGNTKKVSLSVHEDDLKQLKRRAARLYRGNVSAVFAELIDQLKRQEAWSEAKAWYGRPLVMTDEERERIDRELLGPRRAKPRGKRAA